MVCRRFARSVSLRRDSVKQEASVNAAPNPKMVCADFVGSTVTSAAGAFFAGLVQAISGPAARRLPLLSVTSVCAGLAGGLAASGPMFAFAATPNAEAAAAPTPRLAYFRISRRVVTLASRFISDSQDMASIQASLLAGQDTAKSIFSDANVHG